MSIPSDMVAVYDNSQTQWWIYYVDSDGKINFIKGPKDGQVEDSKNSEHTNRCNPPWLSEIHADHYTLCLLDPPYEADNPNISNADIPDAKPGSSQIGVAEYIDNSNNSQVRPTPLLSRFQRLTTF